jgi:hypothetical protein
MGLGDFFPDDLKSEFASRAIEVGNVLRLKVKETKPPKIKRFVIVGVSLDGIMLASVFINSEMNLNINWCQELQLLQIPLGQNGREYLENDSFVDCSKIYPMEVKDIEDVIKKDPRVVLGKLQNEDIELILDTIRNAATIKGKIKKKYGLFG